MSRKPKIQCGNDDSQPRLMARALWGQCNLLRTVAIQCIPSKLLNRSRNSVFNIYSNPKKKRKGFNLSFCFTLWDCGNLNYSISFVGRGRGRGARFPEKKILWNEDTLTPMVDPHFASHLTRGSNTDANIMIPMTNHETSHVGWLTSTNVGMLVV